jgi:quercetin dioxygenase-like cupin family protein
MIDMNTNDNETHEVFDYDQPTFLTNNCGQNNRLEVFSIERQMKRLAECAEFEQIELKVKHYFSDGVYAREIYIPKGCMLTGQIHKYENLNILTKGKLRVLIDDKLQIVEAPFVVVSPPGTKRVALALEDTIWITIHGTYEKDLEKIEQQFICKSEKEYLDFCKNLVLENDTKGLD